LCFEKEEVGEVACPVNVDWWRQAKKLGAGSTVCVRVGGLESETLERKLGIACDKTGLAPDGRFEANR